MTESSTPPKQRRASRPLWIAPLLLVPVLGLLAWHVVARLATSSAIHRLEAKAKQQGDPLTPAELGASVPEVRDDQNAAVLLMAEWEKDDPERWQAFRANRRPLTPAKTITYDPALPYLGSQARKVPRGQPLSAASRAAATTFLQERESHMAAIRAALARPKCCFPIRFEEGFDALLPHLAELKTEAQSFRIAALVSADAGNVDQALLELEHLTRTGQLLADERLLVSQLVRLSCLQMVIEGAEQLLSRQSLSTSQLAKLKAILVGVDTPGALRLALASDRAMLLGAFALPRDVVARATEDETEDGYKAYQLGMGMMKALGLVNADRRLMLDAMDRLITLAETGTPEALVQVPQVVTRATARARKLPPKIFSALLLPSMQSVPKKFASLQAMRGAALVAVAIERYRLDHEGKLPADLKALVPGYLDLIPTDPFESDSLRFKPLATGYVVYSVGDDRHDDGGRERNSKPRSAAYDETFKVER